MCVLERHVGAAAGCCCYSGKTSYNIYYSNAGGPGVPWGSVTNEDTSPGPV